MLVPWTPGASGVHGPDGLEPVIQDLVDLVLWGGRARDGHGGQRGLGGGSQQGGEAEEGA